MTAVQIALDSEIGKLNAVLVHKPGPEMENMTPAMAPEVLYDDILNLPLALDEHRQLTGVLRRVATVFELTELLHQVLEDATVRGRLLRALCNLYNCPELAEALDELPPEALATQLIEGTPMRKDTLEKFISPLRHALPPLPNTFFTRDATMCANDKVIIGSMAHRVRIAEALILKAIFKYHSGLKGSGFYFDGTDSPEVDVTVEGGDLLMIRRNLAVIGYSERTTVGGIDRLAKAMAANGPVTDVVAVELPKSRATIHLDMIFTMVDRDKCVVFPPLITGPNRCSAFHMSFEGGAVKKISEYRGVLEALDNLGLPLDPIQCGGPDEFTQEREQWASGANFFTFAPGQIIGYGHNLGTLEELQRHGFQVLTAEEVITDKQSIPDKGRVVVAMDGAELARGGGGCRCMTMPISRDAVDWH